MRTSRFVLLFALASPGLLACQSYDFEPVEPVAVAQTTQVKTIAVNRRKPNMMLVVDKSGSMTEAINPTLPSCTVGGMPCGVSPQPACPTASCPTRLSDMQSAMSEFLSGYGDVARFGLAVFPDASGASTCDVACPPGRVVTPISTASDDDAQELKAAASVVNATIASIGPPGSGSPLQAVGGTPTAQSLLKVADAEAFKDTTRDNYVVLLTDGLPNCGEKQDPKTCTCTTSQNSMGACPVDCSCLDDQGVISALHVLRSRNIQTVVVGFGADTGASAARPVLNAMAVEGGMPRKCAKDSECGGTDTCELASGTCSTKFYQATNATELAGALKIIGEIFKGDPCEQKLDATPGDPSWLTVLVDGQSVPRGPDTWSYTNDGAPIVTFSGGICDRIRSSTEADPVPIEIRIVEPI